MKTLDDFDFKFQPSVDQRLVRELATSRFGDTAAITALLDRLLHHAHVLKCGPRSWRTKVQPDLRTDDGTK